MTREALELAQRALSNKKATPEVIYAALSAIEAALAQQEQEPVAWRWSESNGDHWFSWTVDWTHYENAKKLGCLMEYAYTSPKHQPLDYASWYESPYSKRLMKNIKVTKMLAVDDRLFALQIPEAESYKRQPLTHEQRLDLLTKFAPQRNSWNAESILIDMVEAAHSIGDKT
jgi:hypothetical protein